MNRRDLLRLAQSGFVASASSLAIPSFAFASGEKQDKRPIALLVPLTGPRARLGLSMRQAALLAENSSFVQVFDTQGTAAGAAAAAALALKKNPPALILGPLLAEEVPAVSSTVAGRVPVISFSNDSVLKQPGTWIFGITAGQVTSAVLRYARSRGVRSVTVIDDHSPWSAATLLAAGQLEGELGIRVHPLGIMSEPHGLIGEADDAVLIPNSSEAVLREATGIKALGAQLLGTFQSLDDRPEALAALDGAWLASPDPVSFGTFAGEFAARNGTKPGAIAALAYDAAGIANKLRGDNKLNPEGLLSSTGFHGVTGPVRFRTDGSVARDFAILAATTQGYEAVAVSSGS